MLKAMRTRTTIVLATVGVVAVGAAPVAPTALARHHHHHHRRIPQHNGGDHDADNSGAPSDGDGNV